MQPELQPIRTGSSVPAQDYAARQHRVLRNTYWLLAISLIPTVIGAAIGTNIDLGFLRASPALSFFAILAIFYGWIFAIELFAMAGIAATTKRDLTGLGNFLSVGAIVIMLGVVANVFFASPVAQLVIVAAFVLFSSLLILWQINALVRGGETNYVSATLTLYVAIYNLFSSLLQLLGIFGGSRD